MQNRILTVGTITALSIGLFSNAAIAKPPRMDAPNPPEVNGMKEKAKRFFAKDFSNEDLLNILADIENGIQNNDIKEVREKSDDIMDYLNYRKSESKQHNGRITGSSRDYTGDKVLELEYGNWLNSKEIVLPLVINHRPLSVDLLRNRMALAAFQTNEIDDVKIRYVSYDLTNKKTGSDLHKLLSSLEEGDLSQVRHNIENVYDDILIDHDSKISLVAKIRDSLAVARFLVENNQSKAAQNSIGATDSMMLRLIEMKSDSPAEQQKIETLRRELNNISKVSDDNYISEWEKIPEEIEGWWKKK